ncbi:hypothetical protein RRSWK_05154 [Rhodopirellula sp. SWK7]|nr:hypothetical protein RRSWK_05154 [Rhodopirellula sp. SWK7]
MLTKKLTVAKTPRRPFGMQATPICNGQQPDTRKDAKRRQSESAKAISPGNANARQSHDPQPAMLVY